MIERIKLFFTGSRQDRFEWRINREIFDRLFPHLQREGDHGYSFQTHKEMTARTEELDPQPMLDELKQLMRQMPRGYAQSFRHILYRDLHELLSRYEPVARRRIQPKECDPRFVATCA